MSISLTEGSGKANCKHFHYSSEVTFHPTHSKTNFALCCTVMKQTLLCYAHVRIHIYPSVSVFYQVFYVRMCVLHSKHVPASVCLCLDASVCLASLAPNRWDSCRSKKEEVWGASVCKEAEELSDQRRREIKRS